MLAHAAFLAFVASPWFVLTALAWAIWDDHRFHRQMAEREAGQPWPTHWHWNP